MIDLNRMRRPLLSALVAAAVAVPVPAAARPAAVPAPAPVASPPLVAAPAALSARYAAGRAGVLAAERVAAAHGDLRRAAMLRALADPARRLLSFDGRDGGRVVEVFGDLAAARRIAVLVPGADTSIDKYGLLRGGAIRLARALGDGSAVVTWLGYATPRTLSLDALSAGLADGAAPALRAFVRELAGAKPGAAISLLCHSYGAVVCGRASPGLEVAHLVLYGSPGAGVDDVAGLRTRAAVWAGRGGGDWIGRVPHLPVPFGFGPDPVSPEFGARVFAAGGGGHSDYLQAGSVSLASIAGIVSGGAPDA
ncbi:alpha/beta hydrolase [Nonomuraea sp. SBT364]|uniref:alpha/beta hydrolase n=1 Tax=Nonomuraea sp. SBT364 TaxID=1580530 RepID=UPI001E5A1D46|nr:alpha/beta hydrolase [Nonomuraea sp. SBT364]